MYTETYKAKCGTLYRPVFEEGESPFSCDLDMSAFCLACGNEQRGEPDMRKGTCESCGQAKVYGLEELVLMGIARIEGDES